MIAAERFFHILASRPGTGISPWRRQSTSPTASQRKRTIINRHTSSGLERFLTSVTCGYSAAEPTPTYPIKSDPSSTRRQPLVSSLVTLPSRKVTYYRTNKQASLSRAGTSHSMSISYRRSHERIKTLSSDRERICRHSRCPRQHPLHQQ